MKTMQSLIIIKKKTRLSKPQLLHICSGTITTVLPSFYFMIWAFQLNSSTYANKGPIYTPLSLLPLSHTQVPGDSRPDFSSSNYITRISIELWLCNCSFIDTLPNPSGFDPKHNYRTTEIMFSLFILKVLIKFYVCLIKLARNLLYSVTDEETSV